MSVLRINPDGSPGPAVGAGSVGICECVILRARIAYAGIGPAGVTAFFSGGTIVVRKSAGAQSDDVTPPGGIPLIGDPSISPGAAVCGAGATPFVDSAFSDPFCFQPSDVVNGKVTFEAEYTGEFVYFGATPIPNQPTATTPISVTVDVAPTCNIPAPAAVCVGGTVSFTATGTGPATGQPYTFTFTGPNGFTQTTPNAVTATVTLNNVQLASAGTYTATVTDIHGCSTTCPVTINIAPSPTCTITGDTPVCPNTTHTYTSTVNPAGGTVTHNWTITGSGTINGSNTGATVSVTAGASGSFTLTDNIVRDGCPSSCTLTVPITAAPTCTITGPTPVCPTTPQTYTLGVLPANGTVTQSWSITGAGTINGSNTGSTISVTPGASGSFTITANVIRDGCPTTCTLTVPITPIPACTITGPTSLNCNSTGNTFTLAVNPAGGTVTQTWTISGAGTIVGSNTGSSVSVTAQATGSVTLTANIIRDGCPATCTITVPVNPCPPSITVTKDVACAPNGVCDGSLTYGSTATGIAAGANCPAFCYRIVVTNNGQDILNTVTINDPDLPSITVPATLAIGESVTIYAQKSWCANQAPSPNGHVNTVTVTGVGANSGTTVTATDTATVIVVPVGVTCVKYVSVDGGERVPAFEIPAGGNPHSVVYSVDITNTGDADLTVTVTDSNAACAAPGPVAVAAGATVTVELCTLEINCPINDNGINTVTVTAVVDQPEEGDICDLGPNGQQITVTSTCTAEITCAPEECITRTQGYWFNHVIGGGGCATLEAAINAAGGSFNLGFTTVNLNQAIGYFWTKGRQGSAVCDARKKAATQLIAAMANVALLNEEGTCTFGTDLVARAQEALASCDLSAIQAIHSELDEFNNSGDDLDFPEGLRPCGAGREQKNYINANAVAPTAACSNCP